ncbi:isoaspartyl peptidase/L-asparaginase [bacterium]|nr:MAG: isoaspartyl peptidase/L-asparaginase [bacterium]
MSLSSPTHNFALAIHGGAGDITPKNLPPEQEAECRAVLNEALQTGYALLKEGGRSLDVVEAVVRILEDSPLFNAGKGASFTHDGRNELDASIMDGRTLQAGAVAGVTTVRNPISGARAVMEKSPYVMLIGSGAESFAQDQGLEIVDNSYFFTQQQFEKLEELKRSNATQPSKFGTVGAVALDTFGDLAAATSTGGMMNKRYGRVGDTPIIGGGTYANNATCAVSATGHGEHFICNVAAYDISALIEYKGLSVSEATEEVVLRKMALRHGDGGVIAVDKNGKIAITFNSKGMYRGSIEVDGEAKIGIFR